MAGTGGRRDWSCLTPLRLAERVLDANCSRVVRTRWSCSMRLGGAQRACDPAAQVVRRSGQAESTLLRHRRPKRPDVGEDEYGPKNHGANAAARVG